MDWITAAMTAVCVATTGGIVAHHHLNQEDTTSAYTSNVSNTEAAWKPFTPNDLDDVLFTTIPEIDANELALAANRWHEMLADARLEIRKQSMAPRRSVNPDWGLSAEERQRRHKAKVDAERRDQQRRRQVAEQLRNRRDQETIFTRSERFRRQGSAYPAVNLNRQLRNNRRRSIQR